MLVCCQKYKSQNRNIMKNKILLTVAIAMIGLLGFSTTAEATPGHGNRHKHVFFERGNRVVVWHNNYRQCSGRYGNAFYNGRGYRMCGHMSRIWRGGRCGNAVVRCNHRGCGMFGMTYRNGRYFNGRNGHGYHRGHPYNGRYNRGGGRGNGRYNRGGGRGNGGRYNQGGGRGNGSGKGNGRGKGRGKGRNNGRGNGGR